MERAEGLHLRGFDYSDLFSLEGLTRLDEKFQKLVQAEDPALYQQLLEVRQGMALSPIEWSFFLLKLAPVLEVFLAETFAIEAELAASSDATLVENLVMDFKQHFVLRRARRYRKPIAESFAALHAWLFKQLQAAGHNTADPELAVSRYGLQLLEKPEDHQEAIDRLVQWCVLCLNDPAGRQAVAGWVLFKLPQPTDYARLVNYRKAAPAASGLLETPPERVHRRRGFTLTDPRMTPRQVQWETRYCIYCHDHDGDFCSKGFPVKKGEPQLGFQVNPLGVTLTGCPVTMKISEMDLLKSQGRTIAALAVAMVTHPMVPATGHRICNDCSKGCIYQKQDPVDVPQIETRVLLDVLNLPWGVELYDLLTRWNPLRAKQYLPKPYNGHQILVVGMGPAGFTMAHHLLMEGCAVVGIDGLKIEPMDEVLINTPIRDYAALIEPLDTRVMAGFGGVAEYGITVRWDKNFLKLIHICLLRRRRFQVFGGVRFGGTLTIEDAWQLGFSHVCIATGAGLPQVLDIGNSLIRGMRQASDFLMALQLTGAAKAASLANMQVRLPALVIGGGLSAVDTATEVQMYYITQVEKLLERYEVLRQEYGEAYVLVGLADEDRQVLTEFLDHGRQVRAERARAQAAHEAPNLAPLVRAWGGVTLVYRRGMNESPAYARNHEELINALAEGVYYREGLQPLRALADSDGHISGMEFRRRLRDPETGRWLDTYEEVTLPARAVFVAAGAKPNTTYAREHPGVLELEDSHYQPHILTEGGLQPVDVAPHAKAPEFGPFTSYEKNGRTVTFIGDTHPVFHGSVVKAIASAQRSYPLVMDALQLLPAPACAPEAYAAFRQRMTDLLSPQITAVRRDSPTVIELTVRAPQASRNFMPGQFYRLQNFEKLAPKIGGSRLQTEMLAMSGTLAAADCVRLIVLEAGASSRMVATFKPGDPISLMGPTGAPTAIPENETILVIGGRRGAAAMLALGPALRAAGNRVVFMVGYNHPAEVFLQPELEQCADRLIWSTLEGPAIPTHRPQDFSFVGDYRDNLKKLATGQLTPALKAPAPTDASTLLGPVDRILAIGSQRLLRMVRDVFLVELKDDLKPGVKVIGSVASPMQCMMKGVCAECLQWQVDPETRQRTRTVFSCACQDQPLRWVDLDNLDARLEQNRLAEAISNLWLTYLLDQGSIERI